MAQRWSLTETELLERLIEEHGYGNWNLISTFIPDRTKRQIKNRARHLLDYGLIQRQPKPAKEKPKRKSAITEEVNILNDETEGIVHYGFDTPKYHQKPKSTPKTKPKALKPKPKKTNDFELVEIVQLCGFSIVVSTPVYSLLFLHCSISWNEVIGLIGGHWVNEQLYITSIFPCKSKSTQTEVKLILFSVKLIPFQKSMQDISLAKEESKW
jgi:hypothetical protein